LVSSFLLISNMSSPFLYYYPPREGCLLISADFLFPRGHPLPGLLPLGWTLFCPFLLHFQEPVLSTRSYCCSQ
jgi:hypothetical protein